MLSRENRARGGQEFRMEPAHEVLGCHNLKPADPMQLTAGSQERLVRVRTGAWTMLDIKHETSEMSYC